MLPLRILGLQPRLDQVDQDAVCAFLCVFASDRTRLAIRLGIDTLCLTTFSVVAIPPSYTTLHHIASRAKVIPLGVNRFSHATQRIRCSLFA